MAGALFCPIYQIFPVWFHCTMFRRICCFRLTTVLENCHSDTLHNISRHKLATVFWNSMWEIRFFLPVLNSNVVDVYCPVGVWVIQQLAIISSATVRSPTVVAACDVKFVKVATFPYQCLTSAGNPLNVQADKTASLYWNLLWTIASNMMTSSNGNIFRVTGHLLGEFTCPRWIPLTKASDAQL